MRKDLLILPLRRYNNLLTIGSHMIVLYRYFRRICSELVLPRIPNININRISIAI